MKFGQEYECQSHAPANARRRDFWLCHLPSGQAFCLGIDHNKTTVFSNHEEAVGAVALELLDQTVFPIEISLHRISRRFGAFIRDAGSDAADRAGAGLAAT
jgi:hypothetical protein